MKNNEIFYIPSLEVFDDWETLQKFLERRGNPLYSIGGNLNLRETDIKTLGNLTSVGGDLDLRWTDVETLGNLTSVGGDLDLRETDIKTLGNLTSVGECLDLRNTPISEKYSEEEIRDMVEIGGYIYL